MIRSSRVIVMGRSLMESAQSDMFTLVITAVERRRLRPSIASVDDLDVPIIRNAHCISHFAFAILPLAVKPRISKV